MTFERRHNANVVVADVDAADDPDAALFAIPVFNRTARQRNLGAA